MHDTIFKLILFPSILWAAYSYILNVDVKNDIKHFDYNFRCNSWFENRVQLLHKYKISMRKNPGRHQLTSDTQSWPRSDRFELAAVTVTSQRIAIYLIPRLCVTYWHSRPSSSRQIRATPCYSPLSPRRAANKVMPSNGADAFGFSPTLSEVACRMKSNREYLMRAHSCSGGCLLAWWNRICIHASS